MGDEWDVNSPGAVLARIETKLDKSLTELVDHETRIRAVEKKIWSVSGLAVILSGAAATWITTVLGG